MAIPPSIRDLLVSHLETVDEAPGALVFTSPTGQPLRYSNFRNRVWIPATEAAELPGLDIHELRHTAASLMIRAGADPKLIQTEFGHASIAITYDVYGHLFPDRLDELASRLDELIHDGRHGRDRDQGVGRTL